MVLNKAILWLPVCDFDTPISWDKHLKVLCGDAYSLTQSSSNAHQLDIYLLTPWSRVLLEKLTGFAANKKFPAFYGTQNFITVLTSTRHLSLS